MSATHDYHGPRYDASYDAISPIVVDKGLAPRHRYDPDGDAGGNESSSFRQQDHHDQGHGHKINAGAPNAHKPSTRRAFDRYAARVQTDTDMPVSTEAMLKASADMGIETMLRWPLFRRKLGALKIPSHVSVVALIETPTSDNTDDLPLKQLETVDRADFVDRARILELVENFLVNNNLKNPILGPASLRDDAEAFTASPLAWSGRNCLMVGFHVVLSSHSVLS